MLNEYLVNKEKRKAIQAKEKGRGRRREERNKLLERRVFIFFFLNPSKAITPSRRKGDTESKRE